MSKPATKDQLIYLSSAHYETLLELIDSYPNDIQQQEFEGVSLNRNMRDVLAHLHHWHILMLEWYTVGMKGGKPDMPAKGYTWKDLPMLNKEINERYKLYSLADVRPLFEKSHADIMSIIKKHSNEELFTKKKYPWTGSTSLGAYLVSCTSSHYDWAIKFVKKGMSR